MATVEEEYYTRESKYLNSSEVCTLPERLKVALTRAVQYAFVIIRRQHDIEWGRDTWCIVL